MTSARAVLFRRCHRHVAIDVEIDQAIEYDLRAFVETDLDERVLARLTGNNGVNATAGADPSPVYVGEVSGFRLRRAHRDEAANQDAGSIVHEISPLSKASRTVTIKVRESMDLPDANVVVAGLVGDEASATNLIAALSENGVERGAIRVGTSDDTRAHAIGSSNGVRADLSKDDPLSGAPGLGNPADQRAAVDRGGMIGAVVGAALGVVLGYFPIGHFIAVQAGNASLVDALLLFVFGGICGAVLGGAFGPRLSTHAGFRLVDGMAEGRIAVTTTCAREKSTVTIAVFASAGATDVIVIG